MVEGGEIVRLHVGGCGNHVGAQYWSQLVDVVHHGLDHDGFASNHEPHRALHRNVCFEERQDGQFEPRCVCADVDPYIANSQCIHTSFSDNASHSAWAKATKRGLGANWAKGYCTEGAELVDSVVECVQARLAACDQPAAVN